MKKPKSYPVAPDSVYVWRGFMAPPPKTYDQFADFLGSVFVPACALLQPKVGLRAYVPSMVPQKNKPTALPDQTALMFWATPESHDLANKALAIRIYQNLHGDVYDMTRSKLPEVPKEFPKMSDFTPEQPYYLVPTPADWMLGSIHHVVGARPSEISKEEFHASLYNWASDFKQNTPDEIDGALLCVGNDYAVVWIHSEKKSYNLAPFLKGFIAKVTTQLDVNIPTISLENGLWNDWKGLDLKLPENRTLNFQLERKKNTKPKKK